MTTRLEFSNLPLVEAAIRFTLVTPIPLTYSIVFGIKEKLGNEFPALIEPPKIEAAPGIESVIRIKPGGLIGAVYTGNSQGLVLSIQNHVLSARWTREVSLNSPPYPRYEAMRSVLFKLFTALTSMRSNNPPVILVANIFYVNFVTIPHTESVLERYFSNSVHLPIFDAAKKIQKLEAAWGDNNNVDLRFELQQATAEFAEGQPPMEGYQLTTAAGRRLSDNVDPSHALDDLHDRLQIFFAELISDTAKKEWGFANV